METKTLTQLHSENYPREGHPKRNENHPNEMDSLVVGQKIKAYQTGRSKMAVLEWTFMGDFFQSDNGVKVDTEDFEFLKNRQVRLEVYAEIRMDGQRVRLHNIFHPSPVGFFTDHKNQDKLDNRRLNLRTLSISMSNVNRPFLRPKKSIYRGVSPKICKPKNGRTYLYWRATICVNQKQITIGSRKTEIEAARLYNEAAISLHGDCAQLNITS